VGAAAGGSASELVSQAPAQSPATESAEAEAETDEVEAEVVEERTAGAHTSAELLEKITGTAVDSPLCFTCGTKMRPAGSCFVCEGCGSTSGCS
jgi:ribonucleoside-diphosphate reductase alpha chain